MSWQMTEEDADAGLLEDRGQREVDILGGSHAGHVAEISTAKYNCGAYQIDVKCSCGASYENRMNGCWQRNHQRPERGDMELAPGHSRH